MVNGCMMANGCLSSGENEKEKGKGFDPGFKLFGKTIPVCGYSSNGIEVESKASSVAAGESESKQEEEPIVVESSLSPEFNKDNEGSLESEEEEVRSGSEVENRKDGEDDEGKNGEKPVLKKPDKLLPCPRCESMDTKFCYYNNYNVNQPRHFCKNCQRYWTAGGTLRNVPVGAGRRKNKHSAAAASSHYRQIRSASETAAVAALGVGTDDPDGIMIPCALPAPCVRPLKLGGSRIQVLPLDILDSGSAVTAASAGGSVSASTMLNFGPDGRSKKFIPGDGEQMDWQQQQQHNRDENSCGSSVTGDRGETGGHMNLPSQPHGDALKWPAGAVGAPFFAGPWSYAWNFAGPGPWAPMSWSVVSRSQFGGWAPAPWIAAAPWAAAAAATATYNSAEPVAPASDCGSPTLGKRAQSEPEGQTPNGCLWVPKTLRIDDPGEAAKSSIWTTLGVGNKPESPISGGGMFKAFQPKSDSSKKNSPLKPELASEALRANPAAFSRSLSFQESN